MSGGRLVRPHGVPVTIKDLQITKDMPTSAGAKSMPVISRLKMRRLKMRRWYRACERRARSSLVDDGLGNGLDRRLSQSANGHHQQSMETWP